MRGHLVCTITKGKGIAHERVSKRRRKPGGAGRCADGSYYYVLLKDRYSYFDTMWNFCKKADAERYGRREAHFQGLRYEVRHFKKS